MGWFRRSRSQPLPPLGVDSKANEDLATDNDLVVPQTSSMSLLDAAAELSPATGQRLKDWEQRNEATDLSQFDND